MSQLVWLIWLDNKSQQCYNMSIVDREIAMFQQKLRDFVEQNQNLVSARECSKNKA